MRTTLHASGLTDKYSDKHEIMYKRLNAGTQDLSFGSGLLQIDNGLKYNICDG